jgi:hypothetical protein
MTGHLRVPADVFVQSLLKDNNPLWRDRLPFILEDLLF